MWEMRDAYKVLARMHEGRGDHLGDMGLQSVQKDNVEQGLK
jgi:hypothetical protein